jgi:hypothetical protein
MYSSGTCGVLQTTRSYKPQDRIVEDINVRPMNMVMCRPVSSHYDHSPVPAEGCFPNSVTLV